MKSGKNATDTIGGFNVASSLGGGNINAGNVVIKANNTYYWFADGGETLASDETSTVAAGALITSVTKVNTAQVRGYEVIDLNYSTNLVKSGIAYQVTAKKPGNTST